MTYFVVTFISSGYTGAPGYTKLKFIPNVTGGPTAAEVNAAALAARTLLLSTAPYMPTGVTYSCQTPAQVFDDNGTLKSEVGVTTIPSVTTGSGGTTYPGGVGAVIYWNTGSVNGGHKVKGRTYLVPLASSAFATDGTLVAGMVTGVQGAVNTFVGSNPPPCVNTRTLGKPGRVNATIQILSGSLKDRTAFLRTRRL